MAKSTDFRPNWVSPPGETIAAALEERGLSVRDFGNYIDQSAGATADLLEGRAAITLGLARRLTAVLGASVGFWMSRDFQYRGDVARLFSNSQQWLASLPLSDMIAFGWIKPVPRPAEEVATCLKFFDVPTVEVWKSTYSELLAQTAFRTSPSIDSRPGSVAAWLRQGEIEAAALTCRSWDPKRLAQRLSEIRRLTRKKDPQTFLPELQAACAEHGVAVVALPAPAGCRASGATRFLSRDKALLLLSFRHLTDDHFWFTFFHETGHLVLHGPTRFFLEIPESPVTAEEREANDFAANILVPPEHREALLQVKPYSIDVIRLARVVGVSPGILVGQLQHLGKLRYNQLNGLKRRFQWILPDT